MRAPLATLLAAFALAGCVSGTRTIVVREYPVATPVPTPTPAPAPVPVPLPTPRRLAQLEVALGNPAAGKVPIQTNRAAYVAIFEIIPQQGVTLLHPSTAKQGRTVISGLSWVPVVPAPLTAQRVSNSNSGRPGRAVRYIYALASDTPIRIPDRAMEPGYLEQLLGPASFRAASPQPAVRALARHFAPKVSDEQWAEDLFAVEPRNSSTPTRMARIYCWNGRMYEVPEDIADRAWCPERPGTDNGGVMPTPARPDSVVGNNGRRIGPRVPRTPGRTADLPDRETGRPDHAAKPAHPVKPDHPSTPRNDDAEKAKKEKEEKDKKEKADNERAEKEKKDKADKEKADNERAEKEKQDKADKERAEKADKEKKEKEEADRAEQEKADREKADKAEREKAEKEKADKAEREKAEKEKADKPGKPDEAGDAEAPAKSDDSSDEKPGAGKPDEDGKGSKENAGPAKDDDRKSDKPKPGSKTDSTRNSGKSTPTRGRSTP